VDRARLGMLVRKRRTMLGLSVSRAARDARIGRATWTAVEEASRETEPYNYGPIERVLDWAAGSIEAILAGGEPTLAGEEPPPATEAEATVRKIEEVLYFRPITDSMRVDTIRGIVAEYRHRISRLDERADRADGGPDR
jgi:transcriptional regulator with XRE-family HTH domain